ncbi:MAG TPA: hypothetical protein VFT74_21360 [Isosphaeraceae bacterium]|nr:hypothetical protein [Isosphaeraceae bacterium]
MSPALQVALAVGPLAAYFLLLGLLQSTRRPTVLPGPIDFALLACALGGLVVFGPVGWVLTATLFPGPSLWARLALLSAYVLLILIWAPRSGRRLIVYNIDHDGLADALRDAVLQLDPSTHFEPTVRGFEDHEHGRGLHLETGALRTGVIDAYGHQPETLLSDLEPLLRRQLASTPTRRSVLAAVWFGVGAFTLLSPLAALLLSRPGILTAVRTFFDRLVGG